MNKKKLLKKENNRLLKIWKDAVKTNWNNKCAICDSIKDLNCHHILSYRLYKHFRYYVNNGILLCAGCHRFRKRSPHQDSVAFADWLQKNHPIIYNWCVRVSTIAYDRE